VAVSIDTPQLAVAEATLAAGAVMINDVSGLAEPRIAAACAAHGAALVILHTRVEHKREAFLSFDDVVADVEQLFTERIAVAEAQGLPRQAIVLDPGLGYAKHPHDDVEVLRAYPRFAAYGLAILTGASRKYYAGVITGAEPPERLPETLATVEAVRPYPGLRPGARRRRGGPLPRGDGDPGGAAPPARSGHLRRAAEVGHTDRLIAPAVPWLPVPPAGRWCGRSTASGSAAAGRPRARAR
jgi:hypothetical protein